MIKQTIAKIARRVAPSTMESLEMMRVLRAEVGNLDDFFRELSELREETREILQETNQTRRDHLRIAELTDVVVETLAKVERAAAAGAATETTSRRTPDA